MSTHKESKSANDTGKEAGGPSESGGYQGLKEFFGTLARLAGGLAGLAGIFILVGYLIVMSFISKVKVYGITCFPQEFYKEAFIKFIGDISSCYATHPILFLVSLSLFTLVVYARKIQLNFLTESRHRAIINVAILAVILVSMRPDLITKAYEKVHEAFPRLIISNITEVVLFMVPIPVLVLLLTYLAVNFSKFAGKPYRDYYLAMLVFASLLVSIPVSYGKYIYDIDVYPIVEFDYTTDAGIESLSDLKDDINGQEEGNLFFLMGHTTEREIIFDRQNIRHSARMILVDRSLIRYIKVSKENSNTVRALLDELPKEDIFSIADVEKKGGLPSDLEQLLGRKL